MKKIPRLAFHHLGMAVRSPVETIKVLQVLGYSISSKVYDPLQKVNLIMCNHTAMPAVELIYSDDVENPVLEDVLKHKNESIYHICYEVEDIEETIKLLKKEFRVLLISKPKPAILFENRLVAFYFIKNFGVIELLKQT